MQFFDRYLREEVNPQGLRVQIFPSFDVTDVTFCEKWERNLSLCSATMMEMLTDKYRQDLADLGREIETLRTSGNQLTQNPDFKKKEQDLIQHLERYNKNVVLKKDQKFYKDKLAFSGG